MTQDVLEKFEFFPVKCRIQRSIETFKAAKKRSEARPELSKPVKTKVLILKAGGKGGGISFCFETGLIYFTLGVMGRFDF